MIAGAPAEGTSVVDEPHGFAQGGVYRVVLSQIQMHVAVVGMQAREEHAQDAVFAGEIGEDHVRDAVRRHRRGRELLGGGGRRVRR